MLCKHENIQGICYYFFRSIIEMVCYFHLDSNSNNRKWNMVAEALLDDFFSILASWGNLTIRVTLLTWSGVGLRDCVQAVTSVPMVSVDIGLQAGPPCASSIENEENQSSWHVWFHHSHHLPHRFMACNSGSKSFLGMLGTAIGPAVFLIKD